MRSAEGSRTGLGIPASIVLTTTLRDVEGLRIALGLNRIAVYGPSYGGMVAQGYALRYPQSISKLILWWRYSVGGFPATAEGDPYSYAGIGRPLRPHVIPRYSLQYRTLMPQAEFVMFERSGHFPFIEESERHDAVVSAFLRE